MPTWVRLPDSNQLTYTHDTFIQGRVLAKLAIARTLASKQVSQRSVNFLPLDHQVCGSTVIATKLPLASNTG